jgi:hypothetical protein
MQAGDGAAMSNKAPELKAYGEQCSHCGTNLEAGELPPDTGDIPEKSPEALCGHCGCIFFEGEVVAFLAPRDSECRIGVRELNRR